MRSFVLVLLVCAGCVRAEVVDCGNGVVCPTSMTCDVDNKTCIDPHGLSAPEGTIDFGPVGCGATSPSLPLQVSNFGLTPISIETHATIVGVEVTPAAATIDPGQGMELGVTITAATESIPGSPFEGSVVLKTPYELLERPIRFETKGGIATVGNLDFGETFDGTVATQQLLVRNSGNAPFDVSAVLDGGGLFALTGTVTNLHVEPGYSAPISVTFSPTVNGTGTQTQTAQFTYAGAMCQQPASSVVLTGVASGDLVLVDHTKLDFGTALCGADASTLAVTLLNRSMSIQDVVATISGPNANLYSSDDSTQIAAGTPTVATSALIHVTRLAIPTPGVPKARAAVLDLDIKQAALVKHVDLASVVAGSVLAVDTTDIDFGAIPKGGTTTRLVRLSNASTLSTVTISPTSVLGGGGAKLTVSPTTFQVGRGGVVPITFQFTAGATATAIPPTTFTFNAVGQCSVPPTVTVQGTVTTAGGGTMVVIEDPPQP
jgi:hypothetical protein